MGSKEKLIKMLNEALAQKHACQIRYLTHAAVLSGRYAELVGNRLKEIAEDEKNHAIQLRDRITALGGTPTMEIANESLIHAKTWKEILQVNLEEEETAIKLYRSILHTVGQEEEILYETVEDILKDEQEHTKKLERFKE